MAQVALLLGSSATGYEAQVPASQPGSPVLRLPLGQDGHHREQARAEDLRLHGRHQRQAQTQKAGRSRLGTVARSIVHLVRARLAVGGSRRQRNRSSCQRLNCSCNGRAWTGLTSCEQNALPLWLHSKGPARGTGCSAVARVCVRILGEPGGWKDACHVQQTDEVSPSHPG